MHLLYLFAKSCQVNIINSHDVQAVSHSLKKGGDVMSEILALVFLILFMVLLIIIAIKK